MKPVAITGVGVVSSLGVGWSAFVEALGSPAPAEFSRAPATVPRSPHPALRVAEVAGFDAARYVGDKGLRNNDRLTRLSIVAARLCLEHAAIKAGGAFTSYDGDGVGVVASTAYGSTEAVAENNRIAKTEDPRYLNPARFPNTVINSAFGYVSIWEELRALNVTVTNGPTGPLDAMSCAGVYLDAGRARAIVAGGAEASSELLWESLLRVGALACEGDERHPPNAGITLGEGAALFALESPADAAARGARVLGELVGYGSQFDHDAAAPHLVAPSSTALARAIREALDDAGVAPGEVDLVVSGLCGQPALDEAERAAIAAALPAAAVCAPKARLGETFGASGALALACALGWFEGAAVRDGVSGEIPPRIDTVVITALGFYGNASALVVRRAK
ncbi:MAG: beta-ketoacyl synthase N-terminal-like domain-containing protein [Polyangiales bacterium]